MSSHENCKFCSKFEQPLSHIMYLLNRAAFQIDNLLMRSLLAIRMCVTVSLSLSTPNHPDVHNAPMMFSWLFPIVLFCLLRPYGAMTMDGEDKDVIATTSCDIRLRGYEARLDLYYFYKVEYSLEPINLFLLERALATSVASTLNDCDENKMPIYAVELHMPSHEVIDGDQTLCASALENGHLCTLFRGESSILLDNEVGGVDTLVYNALESTLNDEDYLQRTVSSNIVQATFIYPMSQNLVIIGKPSEPQEVKGITNGTLKVVVSAATVSVFIAFVFMFGMLRNRSPQEDLMKQHDAKNRLHFYHMQRRQFFEHLEDEPSLDADWMDTTKKKPASKSPTTTWSVSDLTSDTHSIKESLPMVRIDEESALEVYEEVYVNEGSKGLADKGEHLESHHLHFLSKWNKQSDGSETRSYPDLVKMRPHKDSVCDDESSAVLSEETSGRYDFRDIIQVISDRSPSYPKRIEKCDAVPQTSYESFSANEHYSKGRSKEESTRKIFRSKTHPAPGSRGPEYGRGEEDIASISWTNSDRHVQIGHDTEGNLQVLSIRAETAIENTERNDALGTSNVTHSSINTTDISSVPDERSSTIAPNCVNGESNDKNNSSSSTASLQKKLDEKDGIYFSYSEIKFFLYNLWLQSVIIQLERSKQDKRIAN